MVWKYFYLQLLLLILCAPDCTAEDSSRVNLADNQTIPWYTINCFSLKQGSALRNARFRLRDNGKLEFIIQGEKLRDTTGSYQSDGIRFDAAVDFSLRKGKSYRYALSFTGLRVLEAYAGLARLREYIDGTKLTQEILFLFIAAQESDTKPAKRMPFF